jgi:hypothetical protein
MKFQQAFLPVILASVLFVSSCKKDPVNPNDGELITTVKVEFIENISGAKQSFEFRDLDGEGGNAPSKFDEITLSANKTYKCEVYLLNESVTPVDDITLEIEAEADDHQFYYTPSFPALTISNLNKDSKNLPLGTESTWSTGAVSNGTINITLKHKPGSKVANDPISKGDTDVSVDFKVKIQ